MVSWRPRRREDRRDKLVPVAATSCPTLTLAKICALVALTRAASMLLEHTTEQHLRPCQIFIGIDLAFEGVSRRCYGQDCERRRIPPTRPRTTSSISRSPHPSHSPSRAKFRSPYPFPQARSSTSHPPGATASSASSWEPGMHHMQCSHHGYPRRHYGER